MSQRRQLLTLLSDGEYHSGEALGEALGVSRMAVWKHLKVLREMGITITVQRGKGYCLQNSLELLDCKHIRAAISPEVRDYINDVQLVMTIDSTNNWLRARALEGAPSGSVCIAEQQTAGRGRRGREWVSPFAANLYLSLLWRSNNGAAALGGLSLVAGVALLRTLQSLDIEGAGLKWPNDILVGQDKLAGILIDVVGESSGPCAVIIGLGVNVKMPAAASSVIDQSWTDLTRVCGENVPSRNLLAGRLLTELLSAMKYFDQAGLQPFLQDWHRYDLVKGQRIDLLLADECISGTACGIDDSGALLVDTCDGVRRFTSGEVSVRVAS